MILLAALWIIWCTLHSLLISRTVHRAAQHLLGRKIAFYRLFYVGFSTVTLIPVLWYQFTLPGQVIVAAGWPIRTVQVVLLLYSGVMFYGGARMYEMDYFFGLGQLRDYRRNEEPADMDFRTRGILSYVRHPWYSGGIALLWSIGNITDVYLVTRIILTAYILIGTLLEERKLEAALGESYRDYRRRVPMLIPWKKPFRAGADKPGGGC